MLTYRRDGEKEVIAMSKKYYAIYDELDTIEEVFVFDTAADRDEWVNFQDEFSVDTNTTADNCIFQRKAVTADELKEMLKPITDSLIEDIENNDYSYLTDADYNPNMKILTIIM